MTEPYNPALDDPYWWVFCALEDPSSSPHLFGPFTTKELAAGNVRIATTDSSSPCRKDHGLWFSSVRALVDKHHAADMNYCVGHGDLKGPALQEMRSYVSAALIAKYKRLQEVS